ncbi:MAG: FtsX-like permease family protein [Phycisphaera sp.]|nr:FtsX-like permease family protein [Phycisphaera sp.]
MTNLCYVKRSLAYFWRTNLGVTVGAAIATAVLVGALVVGDSVRYSLRHMALQRLGDVSLAMQTNDRYFNADLADRVAAHPGATAGVATLDLTAVATVPGAERRAFQVHTIGVPHAFWQIGGEGTAAIELGDNDIVLNPRLAEQLDVATGGTVLLRIAKPSSISGDIPMSNEATNTFTVRATVKAIADADAFGNFSLRAEQIPPFNAFVSLSLLQRRADLAGRANTLLLPVSAAAADGALPVPEDASKDRDERLAEVSNAAVEATWTLPDIQAQLRELPKRGVIDLRSDRVFIDPALATGAAEAAPGGRVYVTYFVNELRADGGKATPYSMVSTVPADSDLADDQIVITDWLAKDLGVGAGDKVTLNYSVFGEARRLKKEDATFTVAKIVPDEAPGGDRDLMPNLPGLNDVDDLGQWKPPADLGIDTKKIRDTDEKYWDDHRGAPKAFVTLAWAKAHWRTPYGVVTSIRWPLADHNRDDIAAAIRKAVNPAQLGLFFRPVRDQALAASGSGTDFGGLFIGLSFFLMIAALLLTALLFAFGVEQRSAEIGTLLAVGFTPRRVRRLWLLEGGVLATIGSLIGLGLGVGYTKAVLWALRTLWTDAVAGTTDLRYHAESMTLIIGAVSGVLVAVGTMWWAMRKQARQSARALLSSRFGLETAHGKRGKRRWGMWIGVGCIAGAFALAAAMSGAHGEELAGSFFSAGSLLLIGGLCITGSLLRAAGAGTSSSHAATAPTIARLGWRNGGRRSGRSLATVSMLACAVFLIASINAFRQDPSGEALERQSGTGGFALYAESSLPVYHDLNTQAGLDQFGLYKDDVAGVSFVSMRLRAGDDASCLNLNKPQTPPLLGVDPAQLAERDAFAFSGTRGDNSGSKPWALLAANDAQPDQPVPAIVDGNAATYILHKSIGDTITYTDEAGKPFDVVIVGTLTDSILQGRLVISDTQFKRRYPSLSAYRVFLIDAPADKVAATSSTLERALADVGFDAMPATKRLAMFLQVQNTYLTIFGVLGGLGLVLGCVGLGLVVMRNVLERRSELALMRSLGFRGGTLRWLVLSEHWALLMLGLVCGVVAAGIAIWPALSAPGQHIAVTPIVVMLGLVIVSGVVWTVVATIAALRGNLVESLRAE